MMHEAKDANESRSSNPSDIDLQLSILRYLPTAVLVLDQTRKSIWTNLKGGALLRNSRSLASFESGIIGQDLNELGVKLSAKRSWTSILDAVERSRHCGSSSNYKDNLPNGFEVVLNNDFELKDQRTHFRVHIEVLKGDHRIHFILSFESSTSHQEPLINSSSNSTSLENGEREHQAEPTLRTKERDSCYLRKAVFDNVQAAAFILTADEGYCLPNRKIRDMLGPLMGGEDGCDWVEVRKALQIWDEAHIRQLSHDEYPSVVLIRTRESFVNHRYGFVHPVNGHRMTTLMTGECLYEETTGNFLGVICWCEDVQEFGEYLIEKQKDWLSSHETICDLMPHLVWTTTPDGNGDWYSKRWYEYTGLTKEESLGIGYQQVIHPEDLSILSDKWLQGRKMRKNCEVEIRYLRHDGVYRWMHTSACPLTDSDGNVLMWYGTNTDITDIVMSRIEAKRNKHQMLTVLAHTEVSLFCVDLRRVVTMAEGGMLWDKTREVCLNKASFIGKDVVELMESVQPGGVPALEKSMLDILAGKVEMATCKERIGGRLYRTRLVADLEHSSNDGGKAPKVIGCLGLSIDITDMEKSAQLEMDNTRLMIEEQAAKESSKMKSQFLANMSHEMRTPTAGVIGMVDLLSEDETLTTSQREYVSSIQLSGRALLTIVNDILDFSKIESGRLDIEEVPFNLFSTLQELYKLLRVFANQKDLEFIYENDIEESLEVLGDPGRIRQVLSNLLTNALKFTENGSVKISAKGERIPQPDGIEDDRIIATFVIKDTGIGISKTTLDKLFKPFSQGDSSTARLYGGTGLGLTISRNLATLMSGTINLESEQGIGSTATFTIPMKTSKHRQQSQHPHPIVPSKAGFTFFNNSPNIRLSSNPLDRITPIPYQPATHQGKTNHQIISQQISTSDINRVIPPYLSGAEKDNQKGELILPVEQRAEVLVLVVEDNAVNQIIALKTIRSLGFQATAVWNGQEALNYLNNPGPSKPRPDIILMDVQMPIMDGYEATRILRKDKGYEKKLSREIESPGPTKYLANIRGANESKRINHKTSAQTRLKVRDLPIIAMTASAIQGDQEKCIEAGMDGYLSKPVEKKRLEETLLYWAQKAMSDRELISLEAPDSNAMHGKNNSGIVLLEEEIT